jgi:hypothetical protein
VHHAVDELDKDLDAASHEPKKACLWNEFRALCVQGLADIYMQSQRDMRFGFC